MANLRPSRNLHLNLQPRTTSLPLRRLPQTPPKGSLKRVLVVIGSIVSLFVILSTLRAHNHILEHFRSDSQVEELDYAKQIRAGGHGLVEFGESSSHVAAYDPHIRRSDFMLELSASKDAGIIIATATNHHPQSSIDILVWDSPFDPDAVSRCVFDITDARTGAAVPCQKLNTPRERPPRSHEYLEVPPLHAITAEYAIKTGENGSGVALDKGKEYNVRVKSKFKAIWRADIKNINKVYLHKTDGASGMIDWEYESIARGVHG